LLWQIGLRINEDAPRCRAGLDGFDLLLQELHNFQIEIFSLEWLAILDNEFVQGRFDAKPVTLAEHSRAGSVQEKAAFFERE